CKPRSAVDALAVSDLARNGFYLRPHLLPVPIILFKIKKTAEVTPIFLLSSNANTSSLLCSETSSLIVPSTARSVFLSFSKLSCDIVEVVRLADEPAAGFSAEGDDDAL